MRKTDLTPAVVLAGMIVLYVAVFGTLTWRQHANFGTFGFDMGIYDQGIWLLANGERAFVTVRGLHLFGHHVNPILFLFVPLYWLGAGPQHLYLVETLALASGAIPLYLLTRQQTGDRGWPACAVAFAYLMHPSLQWINWWHFHPDALAIAPLLWAWWAAVNRRWRAFAVALVFALAAKEDIGLAVAMLGFVLVASNVRRRGADETALARRRAPRRAGASALVAGTAVFLVGTQVVIPHYLGGDPFYAQQFFPDYGDSLGSVAIGMVTSPGDVIETLTDQSRVEYYQRLILPIGLLPIGAPLLLLIGAPQLAVNALSSLGGTHDARFHYSSVLLAAMFLATAATLGRAFTWRPAAGTMAASGLVVVALLTNIAWSPSPIGVEHRTGIWAQPQPKHEVYRRAIDLIPDDAGVSANYHLIPHLTHRRHAYEWPNPWIPSYYGLRGENAPDPKVIDAILLDRALGQEPALFDNLTGPLGDFEIVIDEGGVVLALRRGPPA